MPVIAFPLYFSLALFGFSQASFEKLMFFRFRLFLSPYDDDSRRGRKDKDDEREKNINFLNYHTFLWRLPPSIIVSPSQEDKDTKEEESGPMMGML